MAAMKAGRRKVLVCGATGFIGRNIVEQLCVREDMQVYGTYFGAAPRGGLAHNPKVSLVKTDLRRRDQVDEVIRGMDVVIQAAAATANLKDAVIRPYLQVTDNAVMNSVILRACFENQTRQVVYFSCATMYRGGNRPVKEEDFDYAIPDMYFGAAWTKVYIEKMCEFYSRIGTTKYAAIRHSNIYGPYDKCDSDGSDVLGATIARVAQTKDGRIVVRGDRSEGRDLLYVSDLVDFVEVLLESQREPFELVNVGFGSSIPIERLVEKIIELSKRTIRVEYDGTEASAELSVVLDTGKARRKYGWRAAVSWEEGVRRTLSWYRDNVSAPAVRHVVF
jgi:nucleoside-diphosphate-sugar epimerase